MCTCKPENDPCPGWHQKQHGQQVEGGDSPSLLCSTKTAPGVLHPALGSLVKEGCGSARVSPEEGHRNYQRADRSTSRMRKG